MNFSKFTSSIFLFAYFITLPIYAESIRVLLTKSTSPLLCRAGTKTELLSKDGARSVKLKAGTPFRLSCGPDGIRAGMNGPFGSYLRIRSNGSLELEEKKYRGDFIVYCLGGTLILVNQVNIEEYLYGVVPGEIPTTWSDEVIRAQSVVARTFALIRKAGSREGSLYDVDNSTLSQVYCGQSKENQRMNDLIDSTRGEVLIWESSLAQTYYHSTCGGKTEDAVYVWSSSLPYLRTVNCPFCRDSDNYSWNLELTTDDLKALLTRKGYSVSPSRISITKKSPSGRAIEIRIDGQGGPVTIKGNDFRNLIGTAKLKSLLFSVTSRGKNFIFKGRGWGHGVGMCQWGAKTMSDRGISYKRILKFYYKGTRIARYSQNLKG